MIVMYQVLFVYGFEFVFYVYGEFFVCVDFKIWLEDFVVEEVFGFELGGEGEYLFLLV